LDTPSRGGWPRAFCIPCTEVACTQWAGARSHGHRTRRDREKDALSDADLELAGYRVMRLTWDDVTVNGERTLRRLRLALKLA